MTATQHGRPIELGGVGGVRLKADGWGPAPAEVLFLHGGGQTRHAWRSTCVRLADCGVGSMAVDLRGHGESDWDPSGRYTIDDMVGDVLAVLRDIASPVVVVGASLGGVLGLIALESPPQPVPAGLVLVDVTPTIEQVGQDRIHAFMASAPDGFGSLEEAAASVAAYLPHRPRPPSPGGLEKNLRKGADGRWRWRWDPDFLAHFLPRSDERRERMLRAASTLSVPTLLVRGKLSDVVAERGVQEFRALVPDAEYVDVAEATHMVAGDENDAFTASIVTFVRKLSAAA
jgi:pimeloyl-ACP methyl ester carboxylesterase